ncbi:hypothetical protein HYV82_02190, partial [Candidatus Woesearchaeota archaeon]|nr:hypothetical protein [Candidatus Woesearchaeota archaeon]
RDIRHSSAQIQPAFVKGLIESGCNVTFLGEYGSPVLFFNCWKQKKEGAMITASHNPAVYTGFKFVEKTGCAYVDQYRDIKRIYEDGKFRKAGSKGRYSEIDGYVPYRDYLKSAISLGKGRSKGEGKAIAVATECLYASAGTVIPRLYEELGLEVLPSHCVPKPDFNNERPEPKGANLRAMAKIVVDSKAAFGVGFDGDCDRSVFIDDKGREINGSVAAAIFIRHIMPHSRGRSVVMTVDCNSELKPLAESFGGKLVWSEVGHGFIGRNVYNHKAVFGGEMSSHFWFEPLPFSDGFIAGLKMAELLASSKKKLSQLVDEVKFAPMLKEYINCETHERKEKVKDSLVQRYKKEQGNATLTRDGIKFFLNDLEWVLIRKSNNMPEVCLVIEARNEARLKELHSKYRKVVDDAIDNS